MEKNNKERYVDLSVNGHGGIEDNISHEEICDLTEEYVVHHELTDVVGGSVSQDIIETKVAIEISDETLAGEKQYSFVYPIYVKKDTLKQFTTGDESMAVEALRQLGGMCASEKDEKLCCSSCTNLFSLTELITHQTLCTSVKYICKTCGKKFQKKLDLSDHIICHQSNQPHACKTCGKLFFSKDKLQTHTAAAHRVDRTHKCTVCKADFLRPSSLSNHMKIHTYKAGRALTQTQSNAVTTIGTLNNVCNLQEPVFSNIQSMPDFEPEVEWTVQTFSFTNDAININNSVTLSTKIDILQEVTVLPTEELAHIEYTLPDSVYHGIDQQYDLNSSLSASDSQIEISPVDVHKESTTYTCRQHDISSSKTLSLTCDEQNHDKSDWVFSIKCQYCDEQFPEYNSLTNHQISCKKKSVKKKHSTSSRNKCNKYACPECKKKFTTKQKMFRHQWIHRKKTYSCEICSSQFEKQSKLDEHRLSIHPANTPFTCNECGKSFVSRQGLWEHGRTHAGSPAYFHCNVCLKSFSSRQGYLIHHRTHTGERPYGCKFCWKAFRDGGTLRKHERIHTGERPHVCPLCLRAFNQKVVLREHVRWVHAAKNETDGLPYLCSLCGNSTQDRDELCAHIVKHSDQMIVEARAKNICLQEKNSTKKKEPKILPKHTKSTQSKIDGGQAVVYYKPNDQSNPTKQNIKNLVTIENTSMRNRCEDSLCLKAYLNNICKEGRPKNSVDPIIISEVQEEEAQEKCVTYKEMSLNTINLMPSEATRKTIHLAPISPDDNTLNLISKQNKNLPVLTILNSQAITNFTDELSNVNVPETSMGMNTIDLNHTSDLALNINATAAIEPFLIIEKPDIRKNKKITSEDGSEELVCGICGSDFINKNVLMEHVKVHI